MSNTAKPSDCDSGSSRRSVRSTTVIADGGVWRAISIGAQIAAIRPTGIRQIDSQKPTVRT